MRKRLKLTIITATIMSSMVLQMGCSKEKNLTVVNNVSKSDPIVMKENIQIEEKILDLKLKDERIFFQSYFEGDKVIGMIKDRVEYFSGEPIKGKDKNFYEIDKEGNIKESERKTNYLLFYDGAKGVARDLYEKSIYYYDFTNGKDIRIKITTNEEVYPENKKGESSYFNKGVSCSLVNGNEKYMAAYGYRDNSAIIRETTGLKLFDIENKKLYHSELLNDMVLSDILYIKRLEAFVVVDDKGQVYKLNMIENKLELDKLVKISIGDDNRIERKFSDSPRIEVEIVDEDSIAITNIVKDDQGNKLSRTNILMMTYNFKNGEISNVIEGKKDEYIRVKQYIPKHNLALISKVDLEDKNKAESVYIAKIKGNSINYLHKLKGDIKEGEDEVSVCALINDSGDRLFISQHMRNKNDHEYSRTVFSICNIKQ